MNNSFEKLVVSDKSESEGVENTQEKVENNAAGYDREDQGATILKDKELHQEDPRDVYNRLIEELIEKYGHSKIDSLATKEGGNIFPCEINKDVREVITDPKDWATYYRLAQAWCEVKKGEKYVKPEGHPSTLHQKERSLEKSEIIVADQEAIEKYKENRPYENFSFEEWEANGFLITKEGLPSKLERKFYELVRSDEFKEWFGDWEDEQDGEDVGVSKMIDKDTGEPQVFFRGDKSRFKPGFIVLDNYDRTYDEKNPGGYQSRRQGVFFTDNKDVAIGYGVDIDATTLGKAGLESEKDHPETFPKMRAWLESFADKDPSFWKNITRNILDYSPEIEKNDYRHRFHDMCFDMRFPGEDEENLWDEVATQRRRRKPSYYMDFFVKSGKFEQLIEGFNSYIKEEDAGFLHGKPMAKKPEWMSQFRELRLDYLTEPLVLSTVFIRSKNPKIEKGIDMTESSDVQWARRDGHDSFTNKEGVGGMKRADEIVVYDLKNIWVARKDHLDHSDMQRVDKMNGITRL